MDTPTAPPPTGSPPAASPGRLEYTPAELLSSHAYQAPLVAGGVRCHGGFIEGAYVSPRGLVRKPAIEAWRARLRAEGEPLIYVREDYVPPQYPSYAQARYLLEEGVMDPITRSLTIISIVEGFGARIRELPLPDLGREIREPIEGTALAHLGAGLFEAHARDEAGHREEGGHKQMWEAARDLALRRPRIPGDVLMRMMTGRAGRGEPQRMFPELSQRMENLLLAMANVMVVEIFAEKVFEWAKQLLGDPGVSSDPEGAARMVAHIQSDEKPHVEYLRTALSEIRARTLISEDGRKELRGADVIDRLFERQLRGAATARPSARRDQLRAEIHDAIEDKARAAAIGRTFESLDEGWSFPHPDDEPLDILLAS
jgi:hypothetical protein